MNSKLITYDFLLALSGIIYRINISIYHFIINRQNSCTTINLLIA